ncbi:MAG TPA: NADH-ubiquinone oxidoreductase-F iron-sulfur binding region domain-containing protein [Acidimicrobiia bacterium]|jgi:NADH:ubiquinone oxidoreductase subunit F (NADH-binding)|nr:NADH-ubiquinone oxidoreductase-F iron-sulfur binding region domain-containing protein [Acidimicrobiia bacterium]
MTTGTRSAGMAPPAAGAPRGARLLPSHQMRGLAEHLGWFGELAPVAPSMVSEIERSGLRGKGGARFPTATKLAAVATRSRGRAVVVANGTEGEPASLKDTVLMSRTPHLVLDGAETAAAIVGAREVIVCVKRGSVTIPVLERAVEERRAHGYSRVPVRIFGTPNRYVSGEETAIVNWLNGGDAKPTFVPPRPFERGVSGRPTLVQNVETLCDIALVARFGAAWYRSGGTADDPGTTLVTLSGAVERPGVYEIALGARLGAVMRRGGAEPGGLAAILVGGYFGTWLPVVDAAEVQMAVEPLRGMGAGLGAGILFAMPREGTCALAEIARATRWLADQNAGQCGPCVNGLDSIAAAMAELVAGDRGGRARSHLDRWLSMVEGRGACKHPDGVSRFVGSGLRVFADEIERHRRRGPCGIGDRLLLPTPRTGGWQ